MNANSLYNVLQSNDSDSSDEASRGQRPPKSALTHDTTRNPQDSRAPKPSAKKPRHARKSSKKSAKKSTSKTISKPESQSQQRTSTQQQQQQQSQDSPRQFHNISNLLSKQFEQKPQEVSVKDDSNTQKHPAVIYADGNEDKEDELESAANEDVGNIGSGEESGESEDDEEAAECEVDDDDENDDEDNDGKDEDRIGDQNNNAAANINAKQTLPDIFSPGNGQDCVTDKLQSLPTGQAQRASRMTPQPLSGLGRPESGHSLTDDDDISVLNLQQESPSYSLFPPAWSARQRSFCDNSRPSLSVVPPLVDALSSLNIRPDYGLDDQSNGMSRPQTSSRATPRAHQRQFLLVGTSATQFSRDSQLRSPRLDLKVKISPRYDLKPTTAFQGSVTPRRSYQQEWSPMGMDRQQQLYDGNDDDDGDNQVPKGGASFSGARR